MVWSGLISFIHVLGEVINGLIVAATGACGFMLMSDLTHRLIACTGHSNMNIENMLCKFITVTITNG